MHLIRQAREFFEPEVVQQMEIQLHLMLLESGKELPPQLVGEKLDEDVKKMLERARAFRSARSSDELRNHFPPELANVIGHLQDPNSVQEHGDLALKRVAIEEDIKGLKTGIKTLEQTLSVRIVGALVKRIEAETASPWTEEILDDLADWLSRISIMRTALGDRAKEVFALYFLEKADPGFMTELLKNVCDDFFTEAKLPVSTQEDFMEMWQLLLDRVSKPDIEDKPAVHKHMLQALLTFATNEPARAEWAKEPYMRLPYELRKGATLGQQCETWLREQRLEGGPKPA